MKNIYTGRLNRDIITNTCIGMMIICMAIMPFASFSGYISYFYTLLMFCMINHFCIKKCRKRNFAYFHFYLLFAFCMYFIQRYQLPSYMGLTGPEGGIGTDDVRYYMGLVPDANTTERWDIALNNSYSKIINLIYPFTVMDPIDAVIINLLGIAFLPYLTNRVSYVLFHDMAISRIAERLILFCPFMMSIGLIIMRDVIGSSLVLLIFYLFITKRYILLLCPLLILAYLKLGFIVFASIAIGVYYCLSEPNQLKKKKVLFPKYLKIIFLSFGIFIIFVIVVVPNLSLITGGRLSPETLFRESFIEYLEGANDDSFLVKLYKLPIVIRIPALIIAFLLLPPLTLNFYIDDIFIPRSFLQNVMAPIYWWFIYGFFFMFILSYRKLEKQGKMLFFIIILVALALGVISLQTRHKAVLLPFIYIAIAYSMKLKHCSYIKLISYLSIAMFILLQLILAFSRI